MNALENRPMPKTEYEIMMQSIHLLIDQLEDEKRIDLDLNLVSASFLNQHLRNILAYLYFEILAFDSRPIEDIILEYLQDNEKEEEIQKLSMLERKRLALALKQHFISRNFARIICHLLSFGILLSRFNSNYGQGQISAHYF